jgi:hypothetical protein
MTLHRQVGGKSIGTDSNGEASTAVSTVHVRRVALMSQLLSFKGNSLIGYVEPRGAIKPIMVTLHLTLPLAHSRLHHFGFSLRTVSL